MNNSADNWKTVALKDCCEIISGATPKRNTPSFWGGDIPWITPKDLSELDSPVLNDAPEHITSSLSDNEIIDS